MLAMVELADRARRPAARRRRRGERGCFDSRSCMTYKQGMTSAEAIADVRAVREPGRRMRSRLLDAAVELFKASGLSGVSVAEIATAAGAYPSQVT